MRYRCSHDIVLRLESNWWYRESILANIPYNPTLLGMMGVMMMELHRNNINITHTIDWGCVVMVE